jgi:hypothetical protein
MKISSVLRIGVAFLAAGTAAVVLSQSEPYGARAQEASPSPGGEVQYGNPPPPQCGPGENGVTKDGRACGGGPIIVNKPFHQMTAEELRQADQERAREKAVEKAYCDAHPDECAKRYWAHDLCVSNPRACTGYGGGGPVQPSTQGGLDWIDPESNQGYRLDLNTGAVLQKLTPQVINPTSPSNPAPSPNTAPSAEATSAPGPQSGVGRPDSMWLGASWTGLPCPPDMSLQTNPSTDLLMHINNGLYFYNTSHTLISSESDYSFWCSAKSQVTGAGLPDCSTALTDTQVAFDPINSRWIVTELSSNRYYLYIAASSYDPGTGPSGSQPWAFYYEPACSNFTPGSGIQGDEPILGITNKRAVVDVQFCNTAGSQTNNADTVLDFDISKLESFSATDPLLKTFNPTGTGGATIFRVRPAQNWSSFDGNSNNEWLAAIRFDVNGVNTGSFVDLQQLSYGSPDTLTDYGTFAVDSTAEGIPPPGEQANCSGSHCLIDAGANDITSLFAIDNTNNGHTYLFAPFAVGVRGSTTTSRVDLFGYDTNKGTSQSEAIVLSSDVVSYPSVAANRGQGLYVNFQNFGSSHYAQSETFFYYYYPFSNGFSLKASGQVTSSTSAYTSSTACYNSLGDMRWGDYTATSYIWPTGSSWTARFFLLDQYATSSDDISLQITGLVPPGT